MALLWHELLKLTGISRAAEPQWAGNWRVVRVITCTRYGEYRFRGISGTACMYDIGERPWYGPARQPFMFSYDKNTAEIRCCFSAAPISEKGMQACTTGKRDQHTCADGFTVAEESARKRRIPEISGQYSGERPSPGGRSKERKPATVRIGIGGHHQGTG